MRVRPYNLDSGQYLFLGRGLTFVEGLHLESKALLYDLIDRVSMIGLLFLQWGRCPW